MWAYPLRLSAYAIDILAGAVAAGANVLISGSSLFKDPDGLEHAVADLRARAEAARPD